MARAVVIGASLAGSMCARVLADMFDEVVIIERDEEVDAPAPGARKAVPQGRHVHALWYTGLAAMEGLYPGLGDELVQGGAVIADVGWDFGWWRQGRRRAPVRTGRQSISMSRPFLEFKLRRRTLALANVRTHRARAEGLTATAGRVDGVLVAGSTADRDGEGGQGPVGDRERLEADLVVDCSGRASQLGNWLSSLGYQPPAPEQVSMEMGYAVQLLGRGSDGRLADGTVGLAALAAPPGQPRSLLAISIEGDRWMLGVTSYAGDRPSGSQQDFDARCRAQALPPLEPVLTAEPLSEVITYRMPTSIRRDYSAMASFPAGVLAAGDSVASFNPVYAQGMTCAAMHAQALQACLREEPTGAGSGMAVSYFKRVKKLTDAAWALSVIEDFRMPSTTGRRPLGTAISHRVGDLYATATLYDPVAHRRFLAVASMESSPTTMMAPSALMGAVRAARRGKRSPD